ncbi:MULTISPECIES: Hpt domain-containing protein [unclassified Sulfitobacter]|uniref:Hpt domain-containing protein n=1 Tax=unclassified Sulfitobacter TaxID=196795 RepID=UPI0007C21949|nr:MULTISPECIES: Hpt domain-containing protein [unclassified Sulfitobacter]KZY05970.1 hypothetical protein A3721_13350 [Sulfitobacter sp. HI0023]KZY24559.1 hypothetical protein A3728_05195 [Sulfitobacter sp. HI0040]KZZ63237.1 hypothetical protein A3764_05655 [Sulfitobacter sp. HI0129]MBO29718.1 phosphorelay protein [Paracoccaceae bacterium]|tara:strand:- start:171 stop:533 length:363 start_codon:yes stop_codon:yes gene_type:complete
MTATTANALPGLERIRARFVEMLSDRQARIAQHTLDAWNGGTPEQINENLAAAQAILHQIAGSAGSIGFAELGSTARACEAQIIEHLRDMENGITACPGDLVFHIDSFVRNCAELISDAA